MKKIISSVIVSLFILTLINTSSKSYPKFAALTGSKCQSCHVNPTGGGMRNQWGVKYSKDNLYLKPLEKANKTTEINPQITKGISVGGDMRMLFMDDQNGEGNPNLNSFFQMQGDLYINAQVNKYINVVFAPGLYIPANKSGDAAFPTKYEIYGMVSNLPAGIFFKVGRFLPNFGLKIPEHRAYNRQYNDFYTPFASDAGIELGISPDFGRASLTLTAELSNGQSTSYDGKTNNNFDFDNQKQFTTSLDFRWATKNGKFTIGAGGSFITNPYKYDETNNINALRQIVGARLAMGFVERVALLGEWTYNRLGISNSPGTNFDNRTGFGEIDITVIKGLELKAQYELYDNLPDNVLNRRRYSFGLIVFPLTGLEIEPVFRVVKEPNGSEIKNDEFQTVIKFYF
jgi:hypothetical protein